MAYGMVPVRSWVTDLKCRGVRVLAARSRFLSLFMRYQMSHARHRVFSSSCL